MHQGKARVRLLIAVVALVSGAVATGGVAAAGTVSPALELHLDSLTGGMTPDSSPNNLGATAQGTLIADGRFDHALRFSAAGDSVSVPDTAVLAPAQITVMAWVRHTGFPAYDQLLVGKPYQTAGCHTDSYALTSGLTSGVRFAIDTQQPGTPSQYSTPDSADSSVWDGQWHAIAGTYDGSTVRLYQDGQFVNSTATQGEPIIYDTDPGETPFSGLYAGNPPNPNGCAFSQQYSGDIDEIRVYDRALSASEIAGLQDPSATVPPEVTDPPTVVAAPADGLLPQGATLHGTVTPNGSAVSDCHFEYGTSTAYGSSIPCAQSVGSGTTAVPVSATVSGLSPNTAYDFKLVAASGDGTASDTGTFSTPAIDTTITSGPNGPTNGATPTFGFTADPADGATFMCSVDHASASACTSPFTTGHLADGSHEVEVAAVTSGGVPDPTPATRAFFVDTAAPVTSPQVVGGSRVGQSSRYHGAVLLIAPATDPAPSAGGVHTRCELVGADAPPPASYGALPDGCPALIESEPHDYVFYAASVDGAGNVGAVSSVAFTVLAGVEVKITGGPSGDTWEKQPSFQFTSSTPGATYRCRLDGGGYAPCQSPWLSPAQDPGQHAFYVTAVAPDGTQSTVQALYYTIQAPRTDPASEPHGHCAVNPFVVDPNNPNGNRIVGCGFGSCPSRIACAPAIDPCPSGAICTLQFTSHFADHDPAITFALLSLCQQSQSCLQDEMDDSWRVRQRFGALLQSYCTAGVLDDATACHADSSVTIIGSHRAISPICYAEVDDALGSPLKPGDVKARDFGPDSERHLDCDATESIVPASAFDMASVSPVLYSSYLYVPAAGQLALTGAGITAFTVRQRPARPGFTVLAARKRPAAPAISAIKLTVRHAGPVAIRFRPNLAAQRVLARRHRLTLRVKITLKLAHQAAITRVRAITLTRPPRPASARQRRQQARRLCLRTHRHARRICNRF